MTNSCAETAKTNLLRNSSDKHSYNIAHQATKDFDNISWNIIKNKLPETQTGSVNSYPYLDIKTIQKILTKLISQKNISVEKLATRLQLNLDELKDLAQGESQHLIPRVNLTLVKIYCETNFYNNCEEHVENDNGFKLSQIYKRK